MTARRLLAMVAALAMIGAAIVVRERVIEDDASGAGAGDGRPINVVCITELADVCRALDAAVSIEAAGTTAAALIELPDGEEATIDAWVTYAPWSQVVRERRERAGRGPVLGDDGAVLARTPLVFAALHDRADALRSRCGEVTWTCVGDLAGQPWTEAGGREEWGAVRPAHADPMSSATGMLVVGHAVGSFLASPDLAPDQVSLLDWEASDPFSGWFQRLERAIPADAFSANRDPFTRWVQEAGLSQYSIVATTEAAAVPTIRRAPNLRDRASVLYPAPVATADVVLVPMHGAADARPLEAPLRDALTEASYRVDGTGAPAGAPALPRTDGLPSPGALDALREYWAEVVR